MRTKINLPRNSKKILSKKSLKMIRSKMQITAKSNQTRVMMAKRRIKKN